MAAPLLAELTLPGVAASVPGARAFVRETLRRWGLAAMADAVELVASELATNAVLHARSTFTVRLTGEVSGALRLQVVDGSVRQPVPRATSTSATTGRGIALIQGLTSDWGVDLHADGKAVWVLFDTSAAGTAPTQIPGSGGRGRRRATDPGGPRACAA